MDDLLDLDWSSSGSSKPASTLQPSRPASTQPITGVSARPGSATPFDFLLTSSGPNSTGSLNSRAGYKPTSSLTPPIRSNTPLTAPIPQAARLTNPVIPRGAASGSTTPVLRTYSPAPSGLSIPGGSAQPSRNVPGQAAKSSGTGSKQDDAFSALLPINGTGGSGSGKDGPGMSLAERAEALDREKKAKQERERRQFDLEHSAFWGKFGDDPSGLDGKDSTGSIGSTAKHGRQNGVREDRDLGDLLQPSPGEVKARYQPAFTTASDSRIPGQAPSDPSGLNGTGGSGKSKMGSIWDTDLLAPTTSTQPGQPLSSSSSRPGSNMAELPGQSGRLGDDDDDPFDLDAFAAKERERTARSERSRVNELRGESGSRGGRTGGSGMRTPVSDFDWGDQGDSSGEEAPGIADQGTSRNVQKSLSVPSGLSRSARSGRATSPPPHIVGQIVEMGFSPAQARSALSNTSTGLDIEAALEILLGQQARGMGSRKPDSQGDVDEEDDDFVAQERVRREENERRRARRAGPSRDAIQPRTRGEIDASNSGRGTPEYTDQAEKYLAQASEIGSSVLSKASSFWNAGKEKAQKMYEEQRKAYEAKQREADRQREEEERGGGAIRTATGTRGGMNGKSRGGMADGRPRWMIDADSASREGEEKFDDSSDDESGPRRKGGAEIERSDFRDEEDTPPRPSQGRVSKQENGHARDARGPNQVRDLTTERYGPKGDEYMSSRDRVDLLSSQEFKPYVPASRRKPASTAEINSNKPSRPITPIPVQLITRTLINASQQQLDRAATAKQKGNEHFKLGRFAESETVYTSGVNALPEGHLHLVSLYSNRAAARLKLGQWEGAVGDCSTVATIIGPAYHPAKEAPLPDSPVYREVKLPESVVKAYTKRAQAYEMGEKWKLALEDWEKLMGLDAAFFGSGGAVQSTRNMAAEGARRSRRMIEGDTGPNTGGSTSTSTGRPNQPTSARPSKPPVKAPVSRPATEQELSRSKGVTEMRLASAQQEVEDAERLRLKDSVDSRISQWKGGKEGNIRALIASLDTVLWPEVMSGGVKVGMGELILEKQVKIRYMKVIARLHPDKLDTKNTTVEQRMIANGVFSALNEAWTAFQNGQ